MVYQNNRKLNPEIRKYGCFMFALLYAVQIHVKKVLLINDIIFLYEKFIELEYMNCNCYILDYAGILNYTLKYFKSPDRAKMLISKENCDFMIRKIKTGNVSSHFILADKYGDEFIDSLQGEGYVDYGRKDHRFIKII